MIPTEAVVNCFENSMHTMLLFFHMIFNTRNANESIEILNRFNLMQNLRKNEKEREREMSTTRTLRTYCLEC